MLLYTTWGAFGRVQCVFTCLHVSLCVWTAVGACQHSFSQPLTYSQRDMTETTSHEIQLPRFLLASWGALSWHKHFVKKKLGVCSCCFLLRAKQDLVGKQLLNSGFLFLFFLSPTLFSFLFPAFSFPLVPRLVPFSVDEATSVRSCVFYRWGVYPSAALSTLLVSTNDTADRRKMVLKGNRHYIRREGMMVIELTSKYTITRVRLNKESGLKSLPNELFPLAPPRLLAHCYYCRCTCWTQYMTTTSDLYSAFSSDSLTKAEPQLHDSDVGRW